MRRKLLTTTAICAAILAIGLVAANLSVASCGRAYIVDDVDDLPRVQAVMVLGARVYGSRAMSDMLRDRADTALGIYSLGKADKILASGDHGQDEYDEVTAMKNHLIDNGVPPQDIFLDHAGFNTYDSMYRAKEVFEVKSLIISTQDFHLPRAVCLARSMGIEAYGYAADKRHYRDEEKNDIREFFARAKAFVWLIVRPAPRFLGPEIPITGDGLASWD